MANRLKLNQKSKIMDRKFKTIDGVHISLEDEKIARNVAEYKSKRRILIRLRGEQFGTTRGIVFPKKHNPLVLCCWNTEEKCLETYVDGHKVSLDEIITDSKGFYRIREVGFFTEGMLVSDASIVMIDKIKPAELFEYLGISTPKFVQEFIEKAKEYQFLGPIEPDPYLIFIEKKRLEREAAFAKKNKKSNRKTRKSHA